MVSQQKQTRKRKQIMTSLWRLKKCRLRLPVLLILCIFIWWEVAGKHSKECYENSRPSISSTKHPECRHADSHGRSTSFGSQERIILLTQSDNFLQSCQRYLKANQIVRELLGKAMPNVLVSTFSYFFIFTSGADVYMTPFRWYAATNVQCKVIPCFNYIVTSSGHTQLENAKQIRVCPLNN